MRSCSRLDRRRRCSRSGGGRQPPTASRGDGGLRHEPRRHSGRVGTGGGERGARHDVPGAGDTVLQRVPTTPVTAKAANEGRTICGEVGDGESAIEGAMHGIAISLVVPLHDHMQMSLSCTHTHTHTMEGSISSNHCVCSDCMI